MYIILVDVLDIKSSQFMAKIDFVQYKSVSFHKQVF